MFVNHRCSTGPAWKDAVGRLRQIERDDREFVRAAPETDRNLVRATAARLYVRYIMIILYCAYYYYFDVLLCLDNIIHCTAIGNRCTDLSPRQQVD